MYEMGWGTQQDRRARSSSIGRPPTSAIPHARKNIARLSRGGGGAGGE
jgi:hypothetical protein